MWTDGGAVISARRCGVRGLTKPRLERRCHGARTLWLGEEESRGLPVACSQGSRRHFGGGGNLRGPEAGEEGWRALAGASGVTH
jgi:hypothetical protein